MNWLTFMALFAGAAIGLSLFMLAAWRVEQQTGNAGWVDTFWSFGMGTVSAAGAGCALFANGNARALLVTLLVSAWALRLGTHVAMRSASVSDDPRYAKLRMAWGGQASSKMLQFLQTQAIVGAPLAMSVIVAAWNPAPGFRVQDMLAIAVLAIGICGEGLADRQLRRFRSKPENEGHICDEGLWRYSRHPNYFFEWVVWLAYPLFAIDLTGSYNWGWFALIGPVCMYWLLTKVSGIPPLEDIMSEKYGKPYADYQQRTSAFFPFPPATTGERSL